MNVLLLNDHLGWDGEVLHGVASLFLTWVPALEEQGHDVSVCILREQDELARPFREKGIGVRFLERGKLDPRTLLDLVQLVREEQIDVIHCQGYGGANFGRLAGMLTNTAVVVHLHDRSTFYPWYQWVADGMLNWSSDVTIAVSESVRDHFLEHRNRFGTREDSIRVLYNCVDRTAFQRADEDDRLSVREELNIPADVPVVGTVTRLHPDKGNEYLIKASELLRKEEPSVRVVLVGEGPDRQKLEDEVEALGLAEHIIFTGFWEDVSRILGLFDVFVLASQREGGSPMALLEAMAMAKPIVTTDVVEIIEEEETGLIIPPRNADALGRAVLRLLKNDRLAKRLGSAAEVRCEDFDASAYVEQLTDIYRKAIT